MPLRPMVRLPRPYSPMNLKSPPGSPRTTNGTFPPENKTTLSCSDNVWGPNPIRPLEVTNKVRPLVCWLIRYKISDLTLGGISLVYMLFIWSRALIQRVYSGQCRSYIPTSRRRSDLYKAHQSTGGGGLIAIGAVSWHWQGCLWSSTERHSEAESSDYSHSMYMRGLRMVVNY
jgi:hypothetical protein